MTPAPHVTSACQLRHRWRSSQRFVINLAKMLFVHTFIYISLIIITFPETFLFQSTDETVKCVFVTGSVEGNTTFSSNGVISHVTNNISVIYFYI